MARRPDPGDGSDTSRLTAGSWPPVSFHHGPDERCPVATDRSLASRGRVGQAALCPALFPRECHRGFGAEFPVKHILRKFFLPHKER